MEYPGELEGKLGFLTMVELPKGPWHRGTVLHFCSLKSNIGRCKILFILFFDTLFYIIN